MMVGNFVIMKGHFLYMLLTKSPVIFHHLTTFFLITLFSSVEN